MRGTWPWRLLLEEKMLLLKAKLWVHKMEISLKDLRLYLKLLMEKMEKLNQLKLISLTARRVLQLLEMPF
jgi:hypothetical protein